MSFVVGFRCLECEKEWNFRFPAYRCSCGGNLAVIYDLKRALAAFHRAGPGDLASVGHQIFAALLPLEHPDTRVFRLPVGGSPLVERPDLAAQVGVKSLYLKDDTRLPSASFKDRASSILLAMAIERGMTRVCTASTGNAGCSMGCLCADAGLEAWVFVPHTAPRAKIAQLLFYGARVVRVEGNYDQAFDLCWQVSQRKGWLNRSTGWNPFTREGKKTVSFEIALQLGWKAPDAVFVPVGDGNIISGVYKGFDELFQMGVTDKIPSIIAVQSTGSNAVSLAVQRVRNGTPVRESVSPVRATTIADSISVDLPRDGVAAVRSVIQSGGDVVEVSDDEIRLAVCELASTTGIFAEPAGAAAYAGLKRWAAQRLGASCMEIVCLVTGNGLKDIDAATTLLPIPILVPPDADKAEQLLKLT